LDGLVIGVIGGQALEFEEFAATSWRGAVTRPWGGQDNQVKAR
jgi:hypothetical protein